MNKEDKVLRQSLQVASILALVFLMSLLSGCAASGPTVITDEGGLLVDKEHKVNVLTATSDSKPLSVQVRAALRNNGQTVTSRIRVSQDSEDTVKLTGAVNNSAVRYEAERVAYGVSGVRFVVNNLTIRD